MKGQFLPIVPICTVVKNRSKTKLFPKICLSPGRYKKITRRQVSGVIPRSLGHGRFPDSIGEGTFEGTTVKDDCYNQPLFFERESRARSVCRSVRACDGPCSVLPVGSACPKYEDVSSDETSHGAAGARHPDERFQLFRGRFFRGRRRHGSGTGQRVDQSKKRNRSASKYPLGCL